MSLRCRLITLSATLTCLACCAGVPAARAEVSAPLAAPIDVAEAAPPLPRPRAPLGAGVDLETSLGLAVPFGRVVDAGGSTMSDTFGLGQTAQLGIAIYPTAKLGLVVGARLTHFTGPSECGKSCDGAAIQLPLLLEVAPLGRAEGPFARVGAGLLPRYWVVAGGDSLRASGGVAEYVGSAGYRWAASPFASLDLALGLAVGRFERLSVSTSEGHVEGEVIAPAWHYALAIDCAVHWHL